MVIRYGSSNALGELIVLTAYLIVSIGCFWD